MNIYANIYLEKLNHSLLYYISTLYSTPCSSPDLNESCLFGWSDSTSQLVTLITSSNKTNLLVLKSISVIGLKVIL